MGNRLSASLIALALCVIPALASAQGVETPEANPAAANPAARDANPAAAPDLKLSSAQKQTIYLSISNLKKRETAPPTFRAAVGAIVPPSVNLQPLPKTVVELAPVVGGYEYAMVANQVLLVDPKNRQVVEVITQ
jgi:hypothetical protein